MRFLACVLLVGAGCGRLGFGEGPLENDNMDPMDPADIIPAVTPPTTNMIAHWSFDNMTPTGALSVVSSDEAQCSAGECATTAPGVAGVAARFDGVNTCYHIPSLSNLDAATYTISVWAKVDSVTAAHPMVMRYTSGCSSPSIRSNLDDTSFAAYDTSDVHQYAWSGSSVLQAWTWKQIAIRWDGVNQSIFVDGLCACNNEPTLGLRMAVTSEFTLGCDPNDGRRMAGALDELRIYDRALTNDEMAALATEGGRTAPMPVACPKQCTITADWP